MMKRKSKNRSPKVILKLLSEEMTPANTPQELKGHAGKLPTTAEDLEMNNANVEDKPNLSEDTVSVSNFSALNFDVNSGEESLIVSRNQNIRRKLRSKRMDEAKVILTKINHSDSSLRDVPPTDKTYDELGLSLEPLEESLDISKAKKEIKKKQNRKHTQIEILNWTNVVSKLNEKFVDSNDNEYTQSIKDMLSIGNVSNDDTINLDMENRQKRSFRKSRKSVHFDIDPTIDFQETDKKFDGTEKTSSPLNSKEGNVINYSSEVSLQNVESHQSKETSILTMIDNSLLTEDPSLSNNSLLHNEVSSKQKKIIPKRKESITFNLDDIILKMKENSPENTEQNNIQSLLESGERNLENLDPLEKELQHGQKRELEHNEKSEDFAEKRIRMTPTESNPRMSPQEKHGIPFSEESASPVEKITSMTPNRSSPLISIQKRHSSSSGRSLSTADKMIATSIRSSPRLSQNSERNLSSGKSLSTADKMNEASIRSSPRLSRQKSDRNLSSIRSLSTADKVNATSITGSSLLSPQKSDRNLSSVRSLNTADKMNATSVRSSPQLSPQNSNINLSSERSLSTEDKMDATSMRRSPRLSPQKNDTNLTSERSLSTANKMNATSIRNNPLLSPQNTDRNLSIERSLSTADKMDATSMRRSPRLSPHKNDRNLSSERSLSTADKMDANSMRRSPRLSPHENDRNLSSKRSLNTANKINATSISSRLSPQNTDRNLSSDRSLSTADKMNATSISEKFVIPTTQTINITPTRSNPRISPQKGHVSSSSERPVNTAEEIDLILTRDDSRISLQEKYRESSSTNENRTISNKTGINNKEEFHSNESVVVKSFLGQASLSTFEPETNTETNPVRLNNSSSGINVIESITKAVQSIGTVNRNKRGTSIKESPKPSTSKSAGGKQKQLTLNDFLERLKTNQNVQKPDSNAFQEMIKKPEIVREINAELDKGKKQEAPKRRKQIQAKAKANLPSKINQEIFQHFLKHKFSKDCSKVLQETVGLFFKNLTNDLSVALASSQDALINKNHLYLLMKSLKIISNWDDLYALSEDLLPANEWKKIVPIEYPHNKIYPQEKE